MTSTRITLAMLLAVIAAAVGCSNDDGPINSTGNNDTQNAPPTGMVVGRIVDVMGRPLGNSTVSTAKGATLTDSTGRFVLSAIPVGSYEVRVTRSGFQTGVATIAVDSSDTTTLDAELREIGLVAAYPFNNSANDAAGNQNHGEVRGAVATADRFGGANRAYSFGGGSFINVPHAPMLNFSGGFTVGAWVRLAGTQKNYTGLIAKGPVGTEHPGYMLLIMEGNVIGTATGQPEYVVLTGRRNLDDGNWHYLTLVTDARRKLVSLFVDGALEAYTLDPSLTLAFDTNQPLLIGVERNRVNFFTGEMDDIRLFNRALSDEEVAELARR